MMEEEKEMHQCDGGERCVSVMEEKEMRQCDGGERWASV